MKKRTVKTLSVSGKVLLRLVLSTVLCAILYVSMLAIATALFSDVIGYQVYDVTTDTAQAYYYADGVTEKDKPDESEEIIVTDLRKVSDDTLAVFQAVTQVMMLVVLAIFPYHILWEFGNRDDTKVRYKGQRPDPLRGYRVGAFAALPYLLLWCLLLCNKYGFIKGNFAEWYRWLTIPFMPYVNWVTSNGNLQSTSIWQLLLLLLSSVYVIAVCGVAYQMGHRQFSIREHLVFAKKKEDSDGEV